MYENNNTEQHVDNKTLLPNDIIQNDHPEITRLIDSCYIKGYVRWGQSTAPLVPGYN